MIQILTDSSCGISQEEAKRLGIDVIPLRIPGTFPSDKPKGRAEPI